MVAAAPPIPVDAWERLEVPEGYRAEVIAGELVVTPSAPPGHHRLQAAIAAELGRFLPPGLAIATDLEWLLPDRGLVAGAPCPDVIVYPADPADPDAPVGVPVLAVEVLSRSDRTRLARSNRRRIEAKRVDYARFGLADYLEVRYQGVAVTIDRYELRGERLEVVATATDHDELSADRPFVYRILPAGLFGT